jgi:predicted nucleotidyltransferase
MQPLIDSRRLQLAEICRRFQVRRLDLFGSAASGEFDPHRSDIDFVVDFDPAGDDDLFHRYFGLNQALEELFGRKVDLVMVGAMKNPYFIESVNRTRQPVYAAEVAQTS